MKISLSQLKEVINIIEDEDDGDGWEAWIALKNWLAQYEAAQQMREPDSLKAGALSLPDVVKSKSNLPA